MGCCVNCEGFKTVWEGDRIVWEGDRMVCEGHGMLCEGEESVNVMGECVMVKGLW